MNYKEPYFGVKLTQQIIQQGENHGAASFFKMPREVLNSDDLNSLGHINFEKYYDYETNSYLKDFKNPSVKNSMKHLHYQFFEKQEKLRKD